MRGEIQIEREWREMKSERRKVIKSKDDLGEERKRWHRERNKWREAI